MTAPRIELFVRSLAPTGTDGHVRDILDRLDALADGDAIDDSTVTVWGEAVRPADAVRTEVGQHVLETIEAFRSWAASEGVRVDRFYETRTVERSLVEDSYTVTSLPIVAMAEYEEGDLAYVTPHEVEGSVRTVQDRLDVIAEQGIETSEDGLRAPVA